MVIVDKSGNKDRICNSCVCKNQQTHKISIGDGIANTTIYLCKKCLYSLYQEIGEINVSVSEFL